MKETYRNGEYTMELSPNGNQWIVRKGNLCVATLGVKWAKVRSDCYGLTPGGLLKDFLTWYYSI